MVLNLFQWSEERVGVDYLNVEEANRSVVNQLLWLLEVFDFEYKNSLLSYSFLSQRLLHIEPPIFTAS
jgi:hypothetical protein